jgi:subtilisin family serine protease
MSTQNQPELPSKIYAEAVVRSVTGASLLRSSSLVTSENVLQFQAEPNLLTLAAERLKAAGFEILDVGKALISIAAEPEIYERAFRTTLEAVERPVLKEMGQPSTATYINSVDGKPFGEIDTSGTTWDDVLDGIAINEPVYYSRPATPATVPPETTTKYLNVPDDVAQGLNATLIHQQGITGKGVRVVMIDSGWYCHPFFRHHNYKVNVVLGPGATDPERDDSGHGTGESANVFATAPEAELTMIKFDVALEGKLTNVTSVAAFKRAIEQRPDIISCSWGSDQRSSQLSPQDKVLAAVIARAVREGIVVIFAAGNGSWGFPAQHPDVIAVGGVYEHLDGSLKGHFEASNYASGFISPVYPGRQVPDICGLVGQLPNGAYIMLPIPPDGLRDQVLSVVGDGTLPSDGWAAFSGTSAAAPQLAGICALMKQVDPSLSPARVKQILQQTARDVVEGFSNTGAGGHQAREGLDLATGYGLADAYASMQAIKAFTNKKCCDDCASSERTTQTISDAYLTSKSRKYMSSKFPKLQNKIDELRWRFEKELQAAIKDYGLEDVELKISEDNFIPRSPIAKIAYSLRRNLEDGLDISFDKNTGDIIINKSRITEEHISSAQGLLKIGRYQETAIYVLIEALSINKDDLKGVKQTANEQDGKKAKELRKLASEALSECGTEISSFDSSRQYGSFDSLIGECFYDETTNKYYRTDRCIGRKFNTYEECQKCQ